MFYKQKRYILHIFGDQCGRRRKHRTLVNSSYSLRSSKLWRTVVRTAIYLIIPTELQELKLNSISMKNLVITIARLGSWKEAKQFLNYLSRKNSNDCSKGHHLKLLRITTVLPCCRVSYLILVKLQFPFVPNLVYRTSTKTRWLTVKNRRTIETIFLFFKTSRITVHLLSIVSLDEILYPIAVLQRQLCGKYQGNWPVSHSLLAR